MGINLELHDAHTLRIGIDKDVKHTLHDQQVMKSQILTNTPKEYNLQDKRVRGEKDHWELSQRLVKDFSSNRDLKV